LWNRILKTRTIYDIVFFVTLKRSNSQQIKTTVLFTILVISTGRRNTQYLD